MDECRECFLLDRAVAGGGLTMTCTGESASPMGLGLGGGTGGIATLEASCFGLGGGVWGVLSFGDLGTAAVSLRGLGGGCGPLRLSVGLPVSRQRDWRNYHDMTCRSLSTHCKDDNLLTNR